MNLKQETQYIVNKYEFTFRKSLGQNFLIDETILDEIISSSNITKEDVVLEIGTGIGTLTKKLIENSKKVIAIEIDKNLITILNNTFKEYIDNKQLILINQDVLKVDINQLLKEENINEKIKIVANLPYYITTPIIMKILEENVNAKTMTLMLQKEVAERINAKEGTKAYGALSVIVNYYAKTNIIAHVSKNSFIPAPKVDSVVLKFDILDEPKIKINNISTFSKIVKGSFSKRRKTILNSLYGYEDFKDKEKIKTLLSISNIDEKRRGETLTIEEFATLERNYEKVFKNN